MIYTVIKIKKNKLDYKIYFDNNLTLIMNEDVFTDYYFYVGKTFEEKQIKLIENSINISKGYDYALKIISKRPYSSKDIYLKLINVKKINSSYALKIIDKLKQNKYIDDKQYAKELIEELINKNYGYEKIIYTLNEDGIERKDYVFLYDAEKELLKAENWINQMVNKFKNQSKKKALESIYNAYLRLGFKNDIINIVLSKINEYDLLGDENDNLKKDYLRITLRMDEISINENKQKIIDKLLRKGYHYYDIVEVMEGK